MRTLKSTTPARKAAKARAERRAKRREKIQAARLARLLGLAGKLKSMGRDGTRLSKAIEESLAGRAQSIDHAFGIKGASGKPIDWRARKQKFAVAFKVDQRRRDGASWSQIKREFPEIHGDTLREWQRDAGLQNQIDSYRLLKRLNDANRSDRPAHDDGENVMEVIAAKSRMGRN